MVTTANPQFEFAVGLWIRGKSLRREKALTVVTTNVGGAETGIRAATVKERSKSDEQARRFGSHGKAKRAVGMQTNNPERTHGIKKHAVATTPPGGVIPSESEIVERESRNLPLAVQGTLQGDRKGQHSIRINDRYRICFVWESKDAFDVEIVDYH